MADGRDLVARFGRRLRDRHFWVVQALVVVITLLHHLFESTSLHGRHGSLAFVPVSLYLVPALYAGLNFGVEGALPTALLSAALALPNAFIWHDESARLGEIIQLSIMVVVAVLVARRVDRETQAKDRAEGVSAQLAQLNATAAAANSSLEPQSVLLDTLNAIVARGTVDAAWVALEPGGPEWPAWTAVGGRPARAVPVEPLWDDATGRVMREGRGYVDESACPQRDESGQPSSAALVIVPIRSSGSVIGALGVAGHPCPVTAADIDLLDAIAHQLSVALQNTRHYQDERRALAGLQVAQARSEAYLRFAVDAQEEERKRLARELHDDTIQALALAKAQLEGLAAERRLSTSSKRRLDGLKSLLQGAIDDARRFCRDLRPSLLDDLGLVQAVDWLVADIAGRIGVQTRLDVEGDPERLADGVEVAVYRIVQEALHNVEKHAAASSVAVTLDFGSDRLVATVADDGCGFDRGLKLHARSAEGGMGLLGMEERARLIGGSLDLRSRPGGGTTVRIEVPRAGGRRPSPGAC